MHDTIEKLYELLAGVQERGVDLAQKIEALQGELNIVDAETKGIHSAILIVEESAASALELLKTASGSAGGSTKEPKAKSKPAPQVRPKNNRNIRAEVLETALEYPYGFITRIMTAQLAEHGPVTNGQTLAACEHWEGKGRIERISGGRWRHVHFKAGSASEHHGETHAAALLPQGAESQYAQPFPDREQVDHEMQTVLTEDPEANGQYGDGDEGEFSDAAEPEEAEIKETGRINYIQDLLRQAGPDGMTRGDLSFKGVGTVALIDAEEAGAITLIQGRYYAR